MRMAITRFEPFRELAAVQARLNRIFSEPYEQWRRRADAAQTGCHRSTSSRRRSTSWS